MSNTHLYSIVPKKSAVRPEILSREEIIELLRQLQHPYLLIGKLTYGCGFRLSEVLSLRVHNFKIDSELITVCFGKGATHILLNHNAKL